MAKNKELDCVGRPDPSALAFVVVSAEENLIARDPKLKKKKYAKLTQETKMHKPRSLSGPDVLPHYIRAEADGTEASLLHASLGNLVQRDTWR
jgi:hypothetical protein